MNTPLEQFCANLAADPSVAGEFGRAVNMGESAGHDARDTSTPALPRWSVELRSGEYYDVAEVHARSMASAIEHALVSLAEDDGWPLTAAEGTISFRRIP